MTTPTLASDYDPPARLAAAARALLMLLCIGCLDLDIFAVQFPLLWRWSNPEPHGGNIVDMAYSPSPSLAVQVAEFGQIYSSSDLDLWLPRDSGTTNWLRAATFLGQRLLVTGEEGTVLYADDITDIKPGTLLDGPTSSWLEGVTASPTLAVAAGDAGAIYTTNDGKNWKKQNSGTSTWLLGAAFGQGVFVVVGESGTIRTSPDGTNWVKATSNTSVNLNRVNFGDGCFTAVGDSGVTLSSTNQGASWFLERLGATNRLDYCAIAGKDRLLVGDHEVWLNQGTGWSAELAKSNGPPAWTYYSALSQPSYFLIAGQSGMMARAYQPPGWVDFEWSTPFDSIRNWLWDVVRLPGFYVAAGDYGTIMTSGNGVDWTLEYVPSSAENTTLLGIGGTTNLLLAVGDRGMVLCSPNTLTEILITNQSGVVTQTVSSLGVVWLQASGVPTTNDLQAVGVLSNSVYFVGGAKGSLFSTTDGTNWTSHLSGTPNLLSCITDWPGGLVTCGASGTLLTSKNGINWTRISTGTANWIYRVRWLNQQLVAVGEKGLIRTSTDGVTWVERSSGTSVWLTDASFVGDTWFVVGTYGTVLTSTDLVNWSDRGTITLKGIYGAATDSRQLVLVGVEGAILRSQVLPDRTPVSFLNYSHVSTNQLNLQYNIYLFGGKPDQQFALERAGVAADPAWTNGLTLEIIDGSGTLYYVESVTGTNLPPFEVYRTRLVK